MMRIKALTQGAGKFEKMTNYLGLKLLDAETLTNQPQHEQFKIVQVLMSMAVQKDPKLSPLAVEKLEKWIQKSKDIFLFSSSAASLALQIPNFQEDFPKVFPKASRYLKISKSALLLLKEKKEVRDLFAGSLTQKQKELLERLQGTSLNKTLIEHSSESPRKISKKLTQLENALREKDTEEAVKVFNSLEPYVQLTVLTFGFETLKLDKNFLSKLKKEDYEALVYNSNMPTILRRTTLPEYFKEVKFDLLAAALSGNSLVAVVSALRELGFPESSYRNERTGNVSPLEIAALLGDEGSVSFFLEESSEEDKKAAVDFAEGFENWRVANMISNNLKKTPALKA